MNRYLDRRQLDDVAMDRLREFAPPEGYWLAYSGGKDSTVILDLARRSGVRFEAHHSLTTVDPPEVVRFVRQAEGMQIDRPPKTMWQLLRHKLFLPTRHFRWCCEALKERGGTGRLVVTGIRHQEGRSRNNRQMVEQCYRKPGTRYLHPIIDWSTDDVWTYIRERSLPYCCLYDEGYKRLGCVLCPLVRDAARDAARWPRICEAWRRAAVYIWEHKPACRQRFDSGDAYFRWWLDRDARQPRVGERDDWLFREPPRLPGM